MCALSQKRITWHDGGKMMVSMGPWLIHDLPNCYILPLWASESFILLAHFSPWVIFPLLFAQTGESGPFPSHGDDTSNYISSSASCFKCCMKELNFKILLYCINITVKSTLSCSFSLNFISWVLARLHFRLYKNILASTQLTAIINSACYHQCTPSQTAKLAIDKPYVTRLHRIVNLLRQLVLSYKLFLPLSVRVNKHKYGCPCCKNFKLY